MWKVARYSFLLLSYFKRGVFIEKATFYLEDTNNEYNFLHVCNKLIFYLFVLQYGQLSNCQRIIILNTIDN